MSPDRRQQLSAFCSAAALSFDDLSLLDLALTHPSAAGDNPTETSNQRLEYLGDAVLGLVISEHLYHRHPDAAEGFLTRLRAAVVDEESLQAIARDLGLGDLLLLGRGEEASGGRERPSNLADAFEAVVGALFIDQGFAAARRFVLMQAMERIAGVEDMDLRDAKSRLQEVAQGRFRQTPVYGVIGERGPDHDKRFTVAVRVGGVPLGRGRGPSKKEAEQAAADEALQTLEGEGPSPVEESGKRKPLFGAPRTGRAPRRLRSSSSAIEE